MMQLTKAFIVVASLLPFAASAAHAFVQSRSLLALCILVALILLWQLHRLRVAQIARAIAHDFNVRLDERVSERTRIAQELHDTLLQSFQGLMLRFQSARDLLPAHPAEALEALDAALDRADQAIAEGRDAIQRLATSKEGFDR
jgi:signal transduction histidine kinase